ncbi:MAG: Asp-tRNA(Asn)/Glu-tRNA(Gln) amidotransferase subunit GatA [Treponema sp.]|nr:Asp-tRNA(Asn)/Glu-tRNA(Gln) amidotransferase subunit GatA [Treponema sp.]
MIGDMTALELAAAIKEKKISVPDAVNAYVDAIEKKDKSINAFITVLKESALKRAGEIQSRIDKGENISPLAGVPIALKDNISTKDIDTTCASKMLKDFKPVYSAAIVKKLESAGMVVVGKLNMDEFSLGNSSESGFFGPVHNPWDNSRTAGGSSGGSAAAIAAGEVPLAIGTDTGGSIRQPCAFCGVTGIKPTYGAVSRLGIAAYGSSLDQAGPMGRNIDDCAALLSVISGPDKNDSTCIIDKPFNFGELGVGNREQGTVKNVRIGLPRNYFSYGVDEDVKTKVMSAAKEFETAGARIEEFDMPLMDYVIPAYNVIGSAEASSNLGKYDGLRYGYNSPNANTLSEMYRLSRSEGFGTDVKRKIMLGSLLLSSEYYETWYKKAQQIRTLVRDEYKKLFERFDMILSPVAPTTAFRLGANNDDPVTLYNRDIFTVSVNLAGLPAVALPCGFDRQNLPVGFQLIGGAFTENRLVSAARVYQNCTAYHTKRPGEKS